MKVALVYGTRPELIKLFPLALELKRRSRLITSVYSSRQHGGLLSQTEDALRFKPDISAPLAFGFTSLNDSMSSTIRNVDSFLAAFRPDVVVVQGDTSTAISAALSAFNSDIAVAHVEAGIRTRDIEPYPEEAYRQMISRIAKYHFCPTELAHKNIIDERACFCSSAHVVGNTELDAIDIVLNGDHGDFNTQKGCVVVTLHRRESIEENIADICSGVRALARDIPDPVIVVVHPNPGVSSAIRSALCGADNVLLVDPIDFTKFVYLLAGSKLVITDSGGVQEDCSYLGIPVVVARNVTDRPEAVLSGGAVLAGASGDGVYDAAVDILNNDKLYDIMSSARCPFGDGTASKKIADLLEESFYG